MNLKGTPGKNTVFVKQRPLE